MLKFLELAQFMVKFRFDLGYKTESCNDETSLMTSSGFKL